ncbi:hypothetical protein [Sphingobacterium sp.]|uniref:hypothetical protein n=1 Tax=Sphingobacterium sp. TaxID=341027 RepID=UPI002FD88AD2
MSKIEFFEKIIEEKGEITCKIAIFKGGIGEENPTEIINNAVREYVGHKGHNQFVEIHLDNPWLRVVIEDINMLKFREFKNDKM